MPHPTIAAMTLPTWWAEECGDGVTAPTPRERMEFAIRLASRNVAEGTGGPFAAAIFLEESGGLVAAGVNRVLADSMAIAHAEVVAIAMAGVASGAHDLAEIARTQLVATTEPCAMCLGAVGWSGVTSLVCGARDEDARRVGFDEGVKPEDWASRLAAGGITVTRDVLRAEATQVLVEYVRSGGIIYNGRATLAPDGEQ